jgi:hypothetical protein
VDVSVALIKSLDKRRVPPYSSGGYLQLFRRWPPF